ncbi:MAG: hypothetical protein CVU29_02600 [Betaproteobacteria bacterium HGW-Betaproteobacteria-22]|nr:MAG: hypothetical protein CVU29_02600 [Betaproteobacteria bacterium HGW-Betaproteobacteria-22]
MSNIVLDGAYGVAIFFSPGLVRETQNKWLPEPITALRDTCNLPVHRALYRFLRSVRLALHLACLFVSCFLSFFVGWQRRIYSATKPGVVLNGK